MYRRFALALLLACAALGAPSASAAYACNVSVTDISVLYVSGASSNVDAVGTATLSCTRAASDASSLTWRLKADNGQHYSSGRRVRLASTSNYLNYFLRRSATCSNSSNWSAPASGTSGVATGTLNFGAALQASTTLSYCIRVRGNQGSPTAGIYTDVVGVFAQYPNSDAGAISPTADLQYTVGVGSQCLFSSAPANISMSYTAFSASSVSGSTAFNLLCSNGLPWTATLSPTSGSLAGVSYSLTASPATGTGNGSNQAITVTATAGAGQAGTCNTSSCTSAQTHTATINY